MLDKIKNDINIIDEVNYTGYQPVLERSTLNSKGNEQVSIENIDLVFSNKNTVTSEMMEEAIQDNFIKNRELTQEMNVRIYGEFQNKLNQYIAKKSGDIR